MDDDLKKYAMKIEKRTSNAKIIGTRQIHHSDVNNSSENSELHFKKILAKSDSSLSEDSFQECKIIIETGKSLQHEFDKISKKSSSFEISESDIKALTCSREKKVASLNAMALRLTKTLQDEEKALTDHVDRLKSKPPLSTSKQKDNLKFRNTKSTNPDDISLEELISKLTKILPNTKGKDSSTNLRNSTMRLKEPKNDNAKHRFKKVENNISEVHKSYQSLKYLKSSEISDSKYKILKLSEPFIPLPGKFIDSSLPISPKIYSLQEIRAAQVIQAYFRGYQVRRITSNLLKHKAKKELNKPKFLRKMFIRPLEDIPILSHLNFGTNIRKESSIISNHVRPLFELAETGDIDAFTESHLESTIRNKNAREGLKFDYGHKVTTQSSELPRTRDINSITESHLESALRKRGEDLNFVSKLSTKEKEVVISPTPILTHESQSHSRTDQNMISDEIDMKKFSNKYLISNYSSVQPVYQTLNEYSQTSEDLQKSDSESNTRNSNWISCQEDDQSCKDESQISFQSLSFKNSVQKSVYSKHKNSKDYSNTQFKFFAKKSDLDNVFTNAQQMSPSHLKSKVNAELVFQDTIGSALSHLQDLQNIQASSEVHKLSADRYGCLSNDCLNTADESLRNRSNAETVYHSSNRFQADIVKLETELNLRISKMEQEMKSKIKNILDSATKPENFESDMNIFDFKTPDVNDMQIEKENDELALYGSMEELFKTAEQTVEKPSLCSNSKSHESGTICKTNLIPNKCSTFKSNIVNSDSNIESNGSSTKNFYEKNNFQKSSGSSQNITPVQLTPNQDDAEDFFDLKTFRSLSKESFSKEVNDFSKSLTDQSSDHKRSSSVNHNISNSLMDHLSDHKRSSSANHNSSKSITDHLSDHKRSSSANHNSSKSITDHLSDHKRSSSANHNSSKSITDHLSDHKRSSSASHNSSKSITDHLSDHKRLSSANHDSSKSITDHLSDHKRSSSANHDSSKSITDHLSDHKRSSSANHDSSKSITDHLSDHKRSSSANHNSSKSMTDHSSDYKKSSSANHNSSKSMMDHLSDHKRSSAIHNSKPLTDHLYNYKRSSSVNHDISKSLTNYLSDLKKSTSTNHNISKHLSNNTIRHTSFSEHLSTPPLSDDTSSSIKTLTSEIYSSPPSKISLHENRPLSPEQKSFESKYLEGSPPVREFNSQSLYKDIAAVSELELHSSLKRYCSVNSEMNPLVINESQYKDLHFNEDNSESSNHKSGASDSSESHFQPDKQGANTEDNVTYKGSLLKSFPRNENDHFYEGQLETSRNSKGGALQSILNHLMSLQKEEEIRFNHQMSVFKLQEQFLIEEAKLKLVSLSSEGGSNVRKRQRAILLQLREQRAHLRRLIETQNLAAQQRQLFFTQHYNLLSSTTNTGSANKVVASRTHSPSGYSNLDLSSSEGLENLSSVSSLSKNMKKLGYKYTCSEDEQNVKRNFEGSNINKEEKEIESIQSFPSKRDQLIRKEEKNKKGKEFLKYISNCKSDESDNINVENSKRTFERRPSLADISQTLQKGKEASIPLPNLSENQATPFVVHKMVELDSGSDVAIPEIENKSDLKPYSENISVEKSMEIINFENDRSLFTPSDKCDKAKSDSEIGSHSNQTLYRNSTDGKRKRKNYNGFPFPLRYALSPRSTSLQYRRQSSESDDSYNLSQNETTSDISDGEGRLVALREELALRKAEADKLKRERKKIIRERLLSQEQALRNQIAAYDNFIQKKKLEIERESQELLNTVTVKPLIKKPIVSVPKILPNDDYNITESFTEEAVIDESLLSDNSTTTENSCKLNDGVPTNNTTKTICNVKPNLITTDIISSIIIQRNDNEKINDCLHEKERLHQSSSEPSKHLFEETFTIPPLPQSDNSAHPLEQLQQNNKLGAPATKEIIQSISPEKESSEKKQLVIILDNEHDINSVEENVQSSSQNEIIADGNSMMLQEVNEKELTSSSEKEILVLQDEVNESDTNKENECISPDQKVEDKVVDDIVSGLKISRPKHKDPKLKKANIIADTILESLVKESVGCIKNLFKTINEKQITKGESEKLNKVILENQNLPKDISSLQSQAMVENLSINKVGEISVPSVVNEEKLSEIKETDLENKENLKSLPIKQFGKEDKKANDELPSTQIHLQSTTEEFYNDTDINETFSISSCEGEWLEGEFWKAKEKIKSQNELREEEQLLNAEIARLEELQKFKERYPNLVIREVPDKPPPPYTPPKGEVSPTAIEEKIKLPQPQTPSNTISVPHRLSKADLRKIASDIVNVVPSKEEIISSVENNSHFLYIEWQKGKNPSTVDYPSSLRSGISETEEIDASETSEAAFNYLTFNLTRQFVCEVYVIVNAVVPSVWATHCFQPKRHYWGLSNQVTEKSLCNHVVENVRYVLSLDSVAKRDSSMMKWAMKKKEPVDQILVQELQMEELSWIQYHEEEELVKTRLAQDIFSSLIEETICVFENILAKTLS